MRFASSIEEKQGNVPLRLSIGSTNVRVFNMQIHLAQISIFQSLEVQEIALTSSGES